MDLSFYAVFFKHITENIFMTILCSFKDKESFFTLLILHLRYRGSDNMPKKHKEFIILINIDLLKIDPEVTLEQFLGLQNVGLNILWKVKKMNFLAPEWYRNETAIVSFKAFWNWYALSKKKKKKNQWSVFQANNFK